MTVYQNICEKVIVDIEQKFDSNLSIEEIGNNELLNKRQLKMFFLISLIIVCSAFLLYLSSDLFSRYNKELVQNEINELRYTLGRDKTIRDSLSSEFYIIYKIINRDSVDRRIGINQGGILTPNASSLSSHTDYIQRANLNSIYKYYDYTFRGLDSLENELYDKYYYVCDIYRKDSNFLEIRNKELTENHLNILSSKGSAIRYLCVYTFITILLCLLFIFLYKYISIRLKRKINDPKYLGLYNVAKKKLSWLTYQAKLSSSTDLGFNLSQLNLKRSVGTVLEDRPLSLPGLSADFNDYIQNVATVFNGKAIICIDELDKIGDEEQMNELLKGVKGVLGQQGTYFILTVSEDALARFSSRFRNERDLLESSFEEIIFLDRIKYELAKNIIGSLTYKNWNSNTNSNENFEKNCLLIWIFGRGIPREIKRNMIAIVNSDESIDMRLSDPIKIWYMLMNHFLETVHSWALINLNSREEYNAYNFLISLEKIAKQDIDLSVILQNLKDYIRECEKLKIIENIIGISVNTDPDNTDSAIDNYKFKKGVLEVIIAGISSYFVCKASSLTDAINSSKQLQEIAELIP